MLAARSSSDSISSQALKGLQPGESSETLILDPNGRIEHVLRLIDDGVALWILVERAEVDALIAWLNRMKFMMQVEIADRSDQFKTIGTLGSPDLPAAAPKIFAGLRIALGTAMIVIISVEFLRAKQGVGFITFYYWEVLNPEKMYAGLFVVMALTGTVLERLA